MADKGKLEFLLGFKTNIGGVAKEVKKKLKEISKSTGRELNRVSKALGGSISSTEKLSKAFNIVRESNPFTLLQKGAQKFAAVLGPNALLLAGQFVSLGAVIAAVGAKSFTASNQVEKTMVMLRNSTSATTEDMEILEDAIVSSTKKIGMAQEQAGRTAFALHKAGLAASESATAILALGEANHVTGIETGVMIDLYTNLVKTLNYTGDELAQITDHMFRTQRLTTASMESVVATTQQATEGVKSYFGELSKATGVSSREMIRDLTSVTALLEPLGREASTILEVFMSSARDMSKENSELFTKLRLMARDHAGQMQQAIREGNLGVAMAELVEGISEWEGSIVELDSMMKNAFGIPGGAKTIQTLKEMNFEADNFKKIMEDIKVAESLEEAAKKWRGFTAELYEAWDKLSAQLKPLGDVIMAFLVPILETVGIILAVFSKIIEVLSPILEPLAGFLGYLVSIVIAAYTVAKVIGVIGSIISFIGTAITWVVAAFQAIVFAVEVIGAILLTPLGIVVAIGLALWAVYEAVKAVFNIDLIDVFMDGLSWIWDTLGSIVDGIGAVWDWLWGNDNEDIDVNVNKTVNEKVIKSPATADPNSVKSGNIDRQIADNRKKANSTNSIEERKRHEEEIERLKGLQLQPAMPENVRMTVPAPETTGTDLHSSMMKTNTNPEAAARDEEMLEVMKDMRDETKKSNNIKEKKTAEDYARRHK